MKKYLLRYQQAGGPRSVDHWVIPFPTAFTFWTENPYRMAYFNNYIAETKDQSPFTTANTGANPTNHTTTGATTGPTTTKTPERLYKSPFHTPEGSSDLASSLSNAASRWEHWVRVRVGFRQYFRWY